MNFIKNLNIREKLSLLFLVLLIPLIVFVLISAISEIRERNDLLEASINLEESALISNLLHEIQKERGLVSGFITSEGTVFGTRMRVQRSFVDEAITELYVFLEVNNRTIQQRRLLIDLPSYRRQIDNMSLEQEEWDNAYYSLRDAFLGRINQNANRINDRAAREYLNAHASFSNAKQYLGQLRTLSNRFIRRNEVDIHEFNEFGNLYTIYQFNLNAFLTDAPSEIITTYRRSIEEENTFLVNQFMRSLLQDPAMDMSDLGPIEWVERFTAVIENHREVEVLSSEYLTSYMEGLIRNKNAALITYFMVVLITIVTAFALAIYIIRFITNSVVLLKSASDDLSAGITDVSVPIYTEDEFGELASSFRQMATKNDQLSLVAEAVGNGNYQVEVTVMGPKDKLGNAIQQMKGNLESLSVESETRSWLLYGISRLNDLMGGTSKVQPTMKKVIDHLCQYIGCELGVVFINNQNNKFEFSAGYGTEESSFRPKSFSMGEGVAGEAILQHQAIVIDQIPEQNLRISTGLSESDPLNILICPMYFNDVPLGVIELASRKVFSERDINLVQEVCERAAVILNSIQINQKTEELLHETQNQAEELEAQQEELRQMNEELKRQRDQLQVSEEELKVSQEELQEKNRELEDRSVTLEEQNRKIQEKNSELENARQAIELKVMQVESISRYKTEFLANMSHELRTPLNSIMILSKLLSEEVEKQGMPKQAEHAQVIHSSGLDLLKLINDILDLSKIESGQIKLEIKEIPLKNLNPMAEFSQIANEKNIGFKTVIDDDVPDKLYTDDFRLRQILKNLLSNAFKFTPKNGKVELRISRFSDGIKFKSSSLRKADDIIAFSVRDTGIGIPKEKHELVFEAFQQADSSTTRKYGGTGLGLSISRELAQLLGGEIYLSSKVNKGSEFTLYLPQKLQDFKQSAPAHFNILVPEMEKPEPQKDDGYDSQPVEKAKTVLVVDDDKGFNKIVTDFAKSKGFDVMQAYNGVDALELLKKRPEAVLLDVQLPDMDGLDILKMIREDKRLKNTQVHVMTAYDDKVRDRTQEIESFLPKPVTLEQIGKAFSLISRDPIRKVLIVEDNKTENLAIRELLSAEKIDSLSAYSGAEALEVFNETSAEIDAVILDLMLPDMDGFSVMEKIRSMKNNANLPIIVYSGKDLGEQEEIKLKKYANTIIIKNEYSYLRLKDEVKLFLRRMDEKLSGKDKQILNLHVPKSVLKDKKVLIVDDDVRNIYSLYNIMDQEGMEVVVANDGKEALQKLEDSNDIDIVLMDIMMPEMDGIECIKRIRQMDQFKQLPVIALTAKAMKEDKEKCLKAGASDYIPKPVETERLISLMRVWVYDRKIKK
jgi:CheY-like chemotaxis protein/signal transduction histidine kinase/HAMP domain-containing protein